MKHYLISLVLFTLSLTVMGQEVFYQRCEKSNGTTICEKVNSLGTFKTVSLETIKEGQCFRKDEDDRIIFYKITKIANTMVWAVAQIVKKSNPKDWGYKLVADFYTFGGANINDTLTPFSCADTPTLSDEAYLRKSCNLTANSRGVIYCEVPRKSSGFGERDLTKEDMWK